jgi:hypothetical protein
MAPLTTKPLTLPAGAVDLGVFVTQRDGDRTSNVWAVRSGQPVRIASLTGTDYDIAAITDVAPDGRSAILQLGAVHGGLPLPWCDDLYLLATDGSRATRLTFNRAHEHAADGRFSSTGRYLAYVTRGADDPTSALALLDLTGAAPPLLTDCTDFANDIVFGWQPGATILAAVCGRQLMLVAPTGTLASVALPYSADAEAPLLVGWRDKSHILLTTVVGGRSINVPIQAREIVVGDDPGAPFSLPWSAPLVATPILAQGGRGASIAPDGSAFAVVGSTNGDVVNDAWWVVDMTTGLARKVSTRQIGSGLTPNRDFGWSGGGQTVLFVEYDPASGLPSLERVDLATSRTSLVASLPADYHGGIWRDK